MNSTLRINVNGEWYIVEAVDIDSDPAVVMVDGERVEVSLENSLILSDNRVPPGDIDSHREERAFTNQTPDDINIRGSSDPVPTESALASGRVFASPMPGIIISVAVSVGDQVVTGDDICVLEAMKMQQVLKADWSGIVRTVSVIPGQQVFDGDPIVELE